MKTGQILIAALLLVSPAFASEDGEAYDDAIDYEISDWDNPKNETKDEVPSSSGIDNPSAEETTQDNETMFIPERPAIKSFDQISSDNLQKSPTTPQGDSLTERLQSDPKNKNESILDGTWIEKISELSPSKLLSGDNDSPKVSSDNKEAEVSEEDADIDNMMNISRKNAKNNRSNAAIFDIAGVMLRMNVSQAEDVLLTHGFKKINARYQVPNFIKWRNEEICRNSGIVGYERLQACVLKKAKKEGFEYVEYIKFAKFETKEEIEVYFTSNFTGNRVHKIYYTSNIVAINGNSPKATYLRNLKIYDFWKKINRKYGVPDDKNTVTWGLGGNKPYLTATTGKLELVDPMFIELDYDKMVQEDRRFVSSDFYNF